ncbi:MAG TPA: urate oxidase [Longimicrobiaceae bacterium]|nr:urate oxidase [Longimicrobiaceae bacterium]
MTRATIADHRYGKAGVRLLRLDRSGERHHLFEADVEISLEGDFLAAYTEGDNSRVVPTDTMKNTVYALARQRPFDGPEELGSLLARHFAETKPQVRRATVTVSARSWARHGDHPSTFVGGGDERATAEVVADAENGSSAVTVSQGIENLLILKSSGSGFEGFPSDRYTTLEETSDRILATRLAARWEVSGSDHDWEELRRHVRTALLDAFAGHSSRSVQHTLHAMAEAVLETSRSIDRIRLQMPNKHYLLADLSPFGLDNPNHVFVPTDEPAGMIEATLAR